MARQDPPVEQNGAGTVRWIGPDPGVTHTCPPPRDGVLVNHVRVDPRSPEELTRTLEGFVRCGRAHVVNFLAVDPIARAMTDRGYRVTLNKSELNLADGLPVAWAARSIGQDTPRMPGTDSFQLVSAWGLPLGVTHFLYGGGTDEQVAQLTDRLRARFSGVEIVGSESPPFRDLTADDLDQAAAAIRATGATAVWIGLGTPKQHVVGQELRRRDAAPLIFCVGAAFDFVAGTKKRAPVWMQNSGLEWTYRLASEPRRLWKRYAIGNPMFVGGFVLDRIGNAPRRPASHGRPSDRG